MDNKAKMNQLIGAIKKDGWDNILTGLGTTRDKRMSAKPKALHLTQTELEDLYISDDIAQRCVDRIPKEMFRAGYEIKVNNKEETGKEIASYLEKLNADDMFRKALKWSRLHGGSAIILGIEDGQEASLPVNINKIQTIKWLACVDRWRLLPQSIQGDLKLPGYGLPSTYMINTVHGSMAENNTIIHASRIIRFDGVEIPEQAFIQNNYWGDSILNTLYNPLRNYNSAHDGAASMMQDFIQTVYELENLADLIASGDDALVTARLQLLDKTRSIIRAVVLQKGESFTRDCINVSGVDQVLTKIEERLIAATNLPHTIALGEGSQGQTSGSSEKKDFYDLVAQEQITVLMPKQMQLIKLILQAKDAPKADYQDVSISYNALWEPTEQEESQTYKANAEADAIYIDRGVIDPIDVTKGRFTSKDSPFQVEIDAYEAVLNPIPGENSNAVTAPDIALNGAQVSSLVEVINAVTSGTMPKESGAAIIKTAFALSDEITNEIMANIGKGFKPKPQEQAIDSKRNWDSADASNVCAIFFSKQIYQSIDKAAAWIVANNYSNAFPMESELSYEFKQKDVCEFISGTLGMCIIGEGITAIIGAPMQSISNDDELIVISNIVRNSL